LPAYPCSIEKYLKEGNMSDFIYGSCVFQDAVRMLLGIVFFGFAIASYSAQFDEGSFNHESHYTHWNPSYRLNTNVVLYRSKDALHTGVGLSGKPLFSLVTEQIKESDWSISIQQQISSFSDCSPLSSLLCFDSKQERFDTNNASHHWVVLRKSISF
jgi:hypothetical protein